MPQKSACSDVQSTRFGTTAWASITIQKHRRGGKIGIDAYGLGIDVNQALALFYFMDQTPEKSKCHIMHT